MTEKDVLMGLLTKTLNKSDEELSKLLYQKGENKDELILKEDALTTLIAEEEKRIDRIKEGIKPDPDALDNQYKRGQKETSEKFEKEFKKKFEFESEEQGLDLISSFIEGMKKTKSELTDEKFKLDPRFTSAEKKWKKETEDRIAEINGEFDQFKTLAEKNQKFEKVRNDIITIFESLNPVHPVEPAVKSNRLNSFLEAFKGYEYEIADDGNHTVSRDGKRVEDTLGNMKTFKDLVGDVTKLHYDLKKQNGKDGAGNEGGDGGDEGGSIIVPKTEQEYVEAVTQETDPANRIKIKAAWDASRAE